jgi:hypothetical protein
LCWFYEAYEWVDCMIIILGDARSTFGMPIHRILRRYDILWTLSIHWYTLSSGIFWSSDVFFANSQIVSTLKLQNKQNQATGTWNYTLVTCTLWHSCSKPCCSHTSTLFWSCFNPHVWWFDYTSWNIPFSPWHEIILLWVCMQLRIHNIYIHNLYIYYTIYNII